ncbi:MAG: 3-dehydroshikimate dehydratase [Planctomycetota bacterium]|jgi:sugar phosphate isomerase/epimerase
MAKTTKAPTAPSISQQPRVRAGVLGACSWSLQPTSPADLAEKLAACGVAWTQLALAPLRDGRLEVGATLRELERRGIRVRSGMVQTLGEDYSSLKAIERTGGVRLDEHWPANRANLEAEARLAKQLGLKLVTLHAGFLPHERGAERSKLLERLRTLVDINAAQGVRVGFETGQESAATLLEVLEELGRPTAGVNFDPANMILYGMGDPVAALRLLWPHVLQVHVKDARAARKRGEWGEETPAGEGDVDWKAFFAILAEKLPKVDCMIEREMGDARVRDIATAARLVRAHGGAAA